MRLELKFLVYGWQDVENRRVIIGILPCVVITSLFPGASMATIACIDMLMVRRNRARGRQVRVLQGAVAILNERKGPRLCISKCGKLGKRD